MRLDHLSYAAPTDHLADVVQRLGSRLGAGFTDGGVHPRFGTRNFVLPLAGGAYLEVVAALDHPAADTAPFGRAVKQRAVDGGGWLGWVVEVPEMADVETPTRPRVRRRAPTPSGRLRPALAPDRRERAARRPAAAVLHPLGLRARAASRLRQRHRPPHHQARDRRRPPHRVTSGSATPTTTRSTTSTSSGSLRTEDAAGLIAAHFATPQRHRPRRLSGGRAPRGQAFSSRCRTPR